MPRIKRKSGGQPGNQNARKHGFYSRVLTPEQQHVLALASKIRGLDGEIAIMRLKIASIVKNSSHDQKLLLEAMVSLSRMLRVKHSLHNADRQQSKDLYKRFVSWLKEDLPRPVPDEVDEVQSGDSSRSVGSDTGEPVPGETERLVPGNLGENELSLKGSLSRSLVS